MTFFIYNHGYMHVPQHQQLPIICTVKPAKMPRCALCHCRHIRHTGECYARPWDGMHHHAIPEADDKRVLLLRPDACRAAHLSSTQTPLAYRLDRQGQLRSGQDARISWRKVEPTWSARRKLKCCSRVAAVASRLTLASDCPTQFRGPSAKGK